MLTVDGLRKRYGAVEALRGASFGVRRGEVLGLIGPNGSGKSTLLACVAGLLAPDGGTVRAPDAAGPLDGSARRDRLVYLPDGLIPWRDQPADWVLDFGAAMFGGSTNWRGELSDALGLDELHGRRIGELSKGQRKRVLLALTLAAPQPLVLMDEPFDGLDLRQTRDAIALFRRVAAEGRSLLLSIHSMTDATRVCDRLVLLSDGGTIAEGTLDELRARAALPAGDLEDVFLALA